MIRPSDGGPRKRSRAEAGAAGVGGGTLLVLLANNMPNDSPLKSWLILIAPSAAVALVAVWVWLCAKYDRYIARREFDAAMAVARSTLQRALDEADSPERAAELRKKLNQLNDVAINFYVNQVELVARPAAPVATGDRAAS
jgi:hypothetical protein